MKLIKELLTTYNPISKFYNKALQTGYDQGYIKGVSVGQRDGYDIGFNKGEICGYQEAINEINKQNLKNDEQLKEKLETDAELIDSIMLFLKSIAEIVNTKFFIHTCFENCDSKFIKNYLGFLDYAESSFELKTMYPETHYHLPELKKAFKKVYQNKLMIEDAEKLF